MKITILLLLTLLTAAALGKDRFQSINVAELEALKVKNPTLAIYDANVESTRSKVGLIQGAHALSSYDKFSASELPADKNTPLVFYCANTMCSASHTAAEHAADLGYKKIWVMVDGVYGWKKAGKALQAYHPAVATEISPLEAKKLVDSKAATIIDVREAEERHEVIPKALWFPLSKSETPEGNSFFQGLDKNQTVVFHCAHGARAKKVAERLAREGYHTAYFQGPDQWKSAGLNVDAGPAQ